MIYVGKDDLKREIFDECVDHESKSRATIDY